MIWSAGLKSVKFTDALEVEKTARGNRIVIDEWLQVKGHEGTVYAMGGLHCASCAVFVANYFAV